MLNIPEVIQNLFKQDSIRKNFRVRFPNRENRDLVNKDIIEESVKFTESTCSQQTLRFGLTEESVIEFECVGVKNISGMTIECGIEIDVSSLSREDRIAYGTKKADVDFPVYYVPYGVFVVEQCKRQKDLTRRKVVAYTRQKQEMFNILGGLHPNEAITISAEDYAKIITTKTGRSWGVGRAGVDLGQTYTTTVEGTGVLEAGDHEKFNQVNYISSYSGSTEVSAEGSFCIIDIDFEPDENDNRAQELYDLIRASIPGGDFTYFGTDQSVPPSALVKYKAYANNHQMIENITGMMRPASINVVYNYDHNIKLETAPIIIEKPGRYVLDMDNIRMLYGVKGTPKSAMIKVRGRTHWPGVADAMFCTYYFAGGVISYLTKYPINNWPIQSLYRRKGEFKVSTAEIQKTDAEKMRIEPTGGYQMLNLGNYYSYDDAIKETDAANAVLEILGSFGNIERDGYTTIKKLSKENPHIINPSDIEDLWYEEGTTKKIGRVSYTYEDAGEQYDGEATIDSSATGSYSLSQNKALELMEDRTQENIENVIKNNFAPNVTDAFYVPVDLTMRGMPWLEDGDPIRVRSDNQNINTFIMKRTLSGVQHLVDDIEAQGVV